MSKIKLDRIDPVAADEFIVPTTLREAVAVHYRAVLNVLDAAISAKFITDEQVGVRLAVAQLSDRLDHIVSRIEG